MTERTSEILHPRKGGVHGVDEVALGSSNENLNDTSIVIEHPLSFLGIISSFLVLLRISFQRETMAPSPPFPPVSKCRTEGREKQSVASELEGTLLKSRSSFPYFMLMALEAGSPVRALVLLLVSPLVAFLQYIVSESLGIRLMIFVAMAGVAQKELVIVSRAVLPKWYMEDVSGAAHRVLKCFGKKYVVTATPTIMVEPFLKDYLNVDCVLGTELHFFGGFCTGLLAGNGLLMGRTKTSALHVVIPSPDIALGHSHSDFSFMALCKEAHVLSSEKEDTSTDRREMKPVIFHDGRLAVRPTPLMSVIILLWFPVGVLLALTRSLVGLCLPYSVALPLCASFGVRVRVRGSPPMPTAKQKAEGMLYVCSHRTLLDPIFVSVGLRRAVAAVTYSISRLTEATAPINTVRLTRNRETDAEIMKRMLKEGDLAVCPEGTTCREEFLLRFSPLFAEVSKKIVPVAVNARVSMFYGNTARGHKWLDPIFFLMNPLPAYDVHFLETLDLDDPFFRSMSSCDVANHVQKVMAEALGFQCSKLTRRDKYMLLANNDGLLSHHSSPFLASR